MADYINADGLLNKVGPRVQENAVASETEMDGFVREVVLDFDFNSVNASAAGTVLGITTADIALRSDLTALPAGASILDAYLKITTPFVGDTLEVDIVSAAKVSAVALFNAAGAAAGTTNAAAGAGTELAAIGYIDVIETTAAGTGALTAGAGKVIVRYVV